MSDGSQAEVVRALRTHRVEVWPGAQQLEECVTRAVRGHELAVAKQLVVRP